MDKVFQIDRGGAGDRHGRVLQVGAPSGRPRTQLVKADRAVPYGRVVEGMVLLQQAGARKVGFVTEPLSAGRGSGAR